MKRFFRRFTKIGHIRLLTVIATCIIRELFFNFAETSNLGHPAIERWWYDGIPEYSQIAVCNIAIGKAGAERELRQYAIEGLVRHKHPTKLVVYGQPLLFDPGVDVKFYEGKLSQIKKETKK